MEMYLGYNFKCIIVLSTNAIHMDSVNRLANSLYKSVIIYFGRDVNQLGQYEFDRPVIAFDTKDSNKANMHSKSMTNIRFPYFTTIHTTINFLFKYWEL